MKREIVAKALAISQKDVNLRRLVKDKALQKFDGDYDVLFSQIMDEPINNAELFSHKLTTSVSTIAGSFAKNSEITADALTAYIENEPLLQIAVPVKAESWDVEKEAAMVAFIPTGIDDEQLEVIKAYDAEGNEHFLSTQVEPDFPVMVIGDNERGGEKPNFAVTTPPDEGGGGSGGGTGGGSGAGSSSHPEKRQSGMWETLHTVRIYNDHEPWYKGDPEIYTGVIFKNHDIKFKHSLPYVNEEHKTYVVDVDLFRWYWEQYGYEYKIGLFESDYHLGFDFSIADDENGVYYYFYLMDNDDRLGEKIVHNTDAYNQGYETSDYYIQITFH